MSRILPSLHRVLLPFMVGGSIGAACGQGPVLIKEVVSREVSVFVERGAPGDVVSREVTVFLETGNGDPAQSVISREVSLVIDSPGVPAPVTDFLVTPSPTGESVTLDWSAYDQWGELDIDHFDLYYTADGPFGTVPAPGLTKIEVPAGTTSFTVTGLPALTDHFFAVVPVDVLGQFEPSVTYSAGYVLSAQAISREVSLFIETGNGDPAQEVVSREVSIALDAPGAPTPIVDLAVTPSATGDSVTLDWSTYDQWSERDITRFDIFHTDEGPISNVVDEFDTLKLQKLEIEAGQTSTTIDGLASFTDHYFAIVPVDALGNFNPAVTYSAAYVISPEVVSREISLFIETGPTEPYHEVVSREVSFLLADARVPGPVTGRDSGFEVRASTTTFGAVTLDYTSYDQESQLDVVRYDAYAVEGDGSFFDSVAALTPVASFPAGAQLVTLAGLQGSTAYHFAVVAVDALGNFDPVVRSFSATTSVPGVGDVLDLAATSGPDAITYTWTAPPDTDAFRTGYLVYFDGAADPVVLPPDATSWTATNLNPGQGYSFRIVVEGPGERGPGVTLFGATWLPNPANVRLSLEDGRVVLRWDPALPEHLVSSYGVFRESAPFTDTSGLTPFLLSSGTEAVLGSFEEVNGQHVAVTTVNLSDGSDPTVASVPVTLEQIIDLQPDAYLKAGNTGSNDRFGNSIAISGNTLVVGAWGEGSTARTINGDPADDSAPDAGAAYVFVREGGTWVQQAYLKASNAEAGDLFGRSVAISGDTVVVGAAEEDSSASSIDGTEDDNAAEGSGAAYVFVRDGSTWSQQAYLKASNAQGGDQFGTSVAISGDQILVGAPQEDGAGLRSNLLADYSFETPINESPWSFSSQGAGITLHPDPTASGTAAGFVNSITPDGTGHLEQTIETVIGETYQVRFFLARNSTVNAEASLTVSFGSTAGFADLTRGDLSNVGQYYPFSFTAVATSSRSTFRLASRNLTGGTVFIDDVTITGTPGSVYGNPRDNSALDAGAAYLFVRNGTRWSQQAYLKPSNPDVQDGFGSAVAISGQLAVVSSPGEDSATGINGDQFDNNAAAVGAAYVFVRNDDSWSQEAYLKPSNPDIRDGFGTALAISGETIVVGAPQEDSNASGVDGDAGNNDGTTSGAAYVFSRHQGTWSQQAYLKASNTDVNDQFGSSLAISGDVLLVGAPKEDSSATGVDGDQSGNNGSIAGRDSGAAYVFVRQGTSWSQQGYLKASNTEARDDFGSSVAISGETLVVGAPSEDSNGTGVQGDAANNAAPESGAAYLFSGTLPSTTPRFLAQPRPNRVIGLGTTTTLVVEVLGSPLPTFQWYSGPSGDSSNPIAGATSSSFTTPRLNSAASYWVRATNTVGATDSHTITVEALRLDDADLLELATSAGTLLPAFDPGSTGYTVDVPYRTASIQVRARPSDPHATVVISINGSAPAVLAPGSFSADLPLEPGINFVDLLVTARDTSTRTYSIAVRRAAADDDPVYRYDFGADGVLPDLTLFNNSGRPFEERFKVENGLLKQRSVSHGGNTSLLFPGSSGADPGFSPSRATFAEARLSVSEVEGRFGIYFSLSDGLYRYILTFTPGGVQVGALDNDPTHFVPLDYSGFHTYRLESPPDSNQLYFYFDGELLFETTAPSSDDTFGFGDGFTPTGNGGDADWDYVVFGQTRDYNPSAPADATLAGLQVSSGALRPRFRSLTTDYSVQVPNSTTELTFTPATRQALATVQVNGSQVVSGMPSSPVPLAVGSNPPVTISVTAPDGITTRTYTLQVTRSLPTTVQTMPASEVTNASARLHGSVIPNANVTAYFEYGPDPGYGFVTRRQFFSGPSELVVEEDLAGLNADQEYHFRLVVESPNGIVTGENQQFTTSLNPPAAITGDPVEITDSNATLVGAVDPRGAMTTAWFEWGFTELYGQTTPEQIIPAGAGLTDVLAEIRELVPRATYHARLVARNSAGIITAGQDIRFEVDGSNVGLRTPSGPPEVTTGAALGIDTTQATLQGTANSRGGVTVVYFEYGPAQEGATYSQVTTEQTIGNSESSAAVSLPASGLLSSTTYHYRVVGRNSADITFGEERFFTTPPPAPFVVTGDASALSTTSVQVTGAVRARGDTVEVFVDYGTDPNNLSNTVPAMPATVTGNAYTRLAAELPDLDQGVRYFYRLRATAPSQDGQPTRREGIGRLRSFDVVILSGLQQQHPTPVPEDERRGSLTVLISPAAIGAGWRFVGETGWRQPGESATGLTAGNRIIEYRPVPGFLPAATEPIALDRSRPEIVLQRSYANAPSSGRGALTVVLKPEALSAPEVPVTERAQWRFLGEAAGSWRDSGDTVSGLVPGSYEIECKPLAGRRTPLPATAQVVDGATVSIAITYFLLEDEVGVPPEPLPFQDLSATEVLAFPFVGQIRSKVGSASGFMVRPRVVATAGHVLFDDGSLAATPGVQWLSRNQRDTHEPIPALPRGFYLMTGYAAQRAADDSPGESTPLSQQLDAAAMYFLSTGGNEEIRPDGFSGYLASDGLDNEFLLSSAAKTLVGYPIDGIPESLHDRMHATPPQDVTFTRVAGEVRPGVPFRTYTTDEIRASGGASGGPLCVLHESGSYYPAAIYLGGTKQTVVRAIDSEVASLFGYAEATSQAQAQGSGGTLAPPQLGDSGNPDLGALEVIIEPATARRAGAGWRINTGAEYRLSGSRLDAINPATYTLDLATIPGFLPPIRPTVEISGGSLITLTFTYEVLVPAPVIVSPDTVSLNRGEELTYAIAATNSPDSFGLVGVLPTGVSFDTNTGIISGTPQEAGRFDVTVIASNSGGSDRRTVAIISRPLLHDQEFTSASLVPTSYRIATQDPGPDLTFSAGNLPAGLTLDAATGEISGTPEVPGTYLVPIALTLRGATATAELVLNITGSPPVITLQPADSSIEFGTRATLTVSAIGNPHPAITWYRGTAPDTSTVAGAGPTLITPPLTTTTSFWARAQSISGSNDSSTAVITVFPSGNANLASLTPDTGTLLPEFEPDRLSYTMEVPHFVTSMSFVPEVEVAQTTITINGAPSVAGETSSPVPLTTAVTPVTLLATAGDGTRKTYTVTVTRTPAAAVATGEAMAVSDIEATVRGGVNPRGPASVYFQYGPTTNYGNVSPALLLDGQQEQQVEAILRGLEADSIYHYRLCLENGGGTIHGEDRTFTTGPARPLVATGAPLGVTTGQATLTGAVNPRGLPTEVFFEWGLTPNHGNQTPVETIDGDQVRQLSFVLTGLTPQSTYYYRLVAKHRSGQPDEAVVLGEDVSFVATLCDTCGDGVADSAPTVTTGSVTEVTLTSAALQGTVNPNDGVTEAWFEIWTDPSDRRRTAGGLVGNGITVVSVLQTAIDLLPGTTYSYRLCASNLLGTSHGAEQSFTAGFLPPIANTGAAEPVRGSESTARIRGTVVPRGEDVEVRVQYWSNFDPTVRERIAGRFRGTLSVPIAVILTDLQDFEVRDEQVGQEVVTYSYRVVASGSGGVSTGVENSFQLAALLGLRQQQPRPVPASDRSGQLLVQLEPAGIGAWRFQGERSWRPAGVPVDGLPTGDRRIEFQPVSGRLHPAPEIVSVVSGAPATTIERTYFTAGSAGFGSLQVFLEPEELMQPEVPEAQRGQWRLLGAADTTWKDAGDSLSGLAPGTYLIESKPIAGRGTPTAAEAIVRSTGGTVRTITYPAATPPPLSPFEPIDFETHSASRNLPYAHVGQLRSSSGSFSGTVTKSRVVSTAAQAVFDEDTLSFATGLSWQFQPDPGNYDPKAQVPRGFYTLDSYAALRRGEDTPGSPGTEALNSNVSVLYFLEDAGRGGFSGFLSDDSEPNELLTGTAPKLLVGYPTEHVSAGELGRMHATPISQETLTREFQRLYRSAAFRGGNGFVGAPLFVQHREGNYYPAAIHVGGSDLCRAIDSRVVDLIGRAEVSSTIGENNTSGGITHTSFSAIPSGEFGAVRVLLEPDDATLEGGWRFKPESAFRASGRQRGALTPGDYLIEFQAIPGFAPPAEQSLTVEAGRLLTVVFDYAAELPEGQRWRLKHFGVTEAVGVAADDADPDGDERTNAEEFAALTDPNSRSNFFQIDDTKYEGTSFLALIHDAALRRRYLLQWMPDRTTQSWETVDTAEVRTLEDRAVTLTHRDATTPNGIYRVKVEMLAP